MNLDKNILFYFSLKDEMHLEPGEYTYDYRIRLPVGLPTSIEAQCGYIRYGLQVVLDRPRFSSDQKFAETFTVIRPLNLNYDISLRVSLIHSKSVINSKLIGIRANKTIQPVVFS